MRQRDRLAGSGKWDYRDTQGDIEASKNIEHLVFEFVIAFRGGIVKAETNGDHRSIPLPRS